LAAFNIGDNRPKWDRFPIYIDCADAPQNSELAHTFFAAALSALLAIRQIFFNKHSPNYQPGQNSYGRRVYFFTAPVCYFPTDKIPIPNCIRLALATPIERHFILFALCWLISFLGCLHTAYFLVSWLFALCIIVAGYVSNEPLELIERKPSVLRDKLLSHIGVGMLLFLPQLILAYYYSPENYLVLWYGCLYYLCMHTLAIVYKYAQYDPLRSVNMNGTMVGISMVLGLMPGLVLGSIPVVIYYYFSAQRNLKYYLWT